MMKQRDNFARPAGGSSESARSVLVTGASGFTGGHLARELARQGVRVRVLLRTGSDASAFEKAGMQVFEGELASRTDSVMERAAEGVETIYHIAAAYRSAKEPDSYYFDVNVGGTQQVLSAARRQGVARVVYCSTGGVHGHIERGPADESAPFRPGDVYQESKLQAEELVREAMGEGLAASIVRPTAIYGPGDMRLLKLFRTIQQGTFRIFGEGKVHYHLVYIDDLVRGLLLAGEKSEAVGEAFILAGPRATTLVELTGLVAEAVGARRPSMHLPLWPLMWSAAVCERVCRAAGVEPPLHRRRADFFVKNRCFSTEKARRVLGYEPQVGVEEGLRRTARWYASQGLIRPVPEDLPVADGTMRELVS